MAVSFVARKCTQCAGKLQYIKEKKIWKCLYCGAEIERQEQYDGLFTIKNVVRQTLLDTAYRRLDSAAKNLIECEKIDSRYVGTIIARLTYDMIRVTTPGACDPRDVKAVFSQLKKSYDQLRALGVNVTDEEEALYEFLEESDIFATLLLVYDSLNDVPRREFVEQMLIAREVYSKPANNNLLSYAIKNGKIDLADQIIENIDNLDPKTALNEVLAKYPDGNAKGSRIDLLLSTGVIQHEDRKLVENYLRDSSDHAATKSRVAIAAIRQGLSVSLDTLLDQVIQTADPETVKETLEAFCINRLSDEDVIRILSFAYECGNLETAFYAMDCLKNSGQFVLVPSKLLIAMLSNHHLNANDKESLLKKSFEFKIDNKSFEAVLTNYLCFNSDREDDRMIVLQYLLEQANNIPTATVENYVIKCTADGKNKPLVVKALFDKNLNLSFFNNLLSKYMAGSNDPSEVRSSVVEILSQKGLKIDPRYLSDYICSSPDDVSVKIIFVKKMIANGSQLRADAANEYLEKVSGDLFSAELFTLIFSPGSTFSARAVGNYLLRVKDRDAVRADNAKTIIDRASGDVFTGKVSITHLGNDITCNLLQAYTLVTNDSPGVALEIADYLVSTQKMKINAEMIASGMTQKLKKYVVANKESLSAATNRICERYKVYSMLF